MSKTFKEMKDSKKFEPLNEEFEKWSQEFYTIKIRLTHKKVSLNGLKKPTIS